VKLLFLASQSIQGAKGNTGLYPFIPPCGKRHSDVKAKLQKQPNADR
jgi:hypothetical protein